MAGRILCSTGTFLGAPNKRDFRLISTYAHSLNCDGFEFMLYSAWYSELKEIGDYLCSTGLSFPVMHCEKRIGAWLSSGDAVEKNSALRLFECNCALAEKIGAQKVVLHLWNGPTLDRNIENNLAAYGDMEKIACRYGVGICVENVVCRFGSPTDYLKRLAGLYSGAGFVFDTKMAAFHGEEQLLCSEEYRPFWDGGRIRHLHINDYKGECGQWDALRALPIGGGRIDFDSLFRFIEKKNYKGDYTVEATALKRDGSVDIAMLNGCFDRIRSYTG